MRIDRVAVVLPLFFVFVILAFTEKKGVELFFFCPESGSGVPFNGIFMFSLLSKRYQHTLIRATSPQGIVLFLLFSTTVTCGM